MLMRWKRTSRLKLVDEADAPPRTLEIFAEVRERLGVPVVPKLYQAYAAFPEFLELHWTAFRPVLESRQFFLLGARLAAEAYTRAHNYFEVQKLGSRELNASIADTIPLVQVLDYYQYLNPLLLLIAVGQMQAFESAVGQDGGRVERASHPIFSVAPRWLDDEQANPQIRRIWEERRHMLSLAFVSEEHRALACWPGFYQEFWSAMKDVLKSPLCSDCQSRIAESAWTLVRELPARIETNLPDLLEAGLEDDTLSAVVEMNQAFVQALSGLMLDISFARIGYEGGTRTEHRSHAAKPPASDTKSKKAGSPPQAA